MWPQLPIQPYQVNLVNALVLLAGGLWGYFHPEAQRSYELIPVAFGLVFLGATPLFRTGNRIATYLVGGLTILLIFALAKPFLESFSQGAIWKMLRLSLMTLSTAAAAGFYLYRLVVGKR
jgi:uncharacterized membrane protein (UPF0136 family)